MKNLILRSFRSFFQFVILAQVLNYTSVLMKDRDEAFYSKGKRQPFCAGGRRISVNSDAGCLRKESSRRKLAIGNETWFESNLKQLSQLKAYSGEYEGVGVQFDERKREDAYIKTDAKEHPYAVLLIIKLKSGEVFTCSGSLLTAEWVLTAAHCFDDDDDEDDDDYEEDNAKLHVWVYAGGNSYKEAVISYMLSNATYTAFPTTAQFVEGSKVIFHPKYFELFYSYDIALVKLTRKFNLTSTVNTIPLETKSWHHRGYKTCVTTGFGVVLDEDRSEDDNYRKSHTLEVKKPCICDFMTRFIAKLEGDEAAGRFICAKPRKDYGICSGDSGSGLICEEDGVMKLRGIAQLIFGFKDVNYCEINPLLFFMMGYENMKCGDREVVSVFLDPYPLLPWIHENVNIFSKEELTEVLNNINSTASLMHPPVLATMLNLCFIRLFFLN